MRDGRKKASIRSKPDLDTRTIAQYQVLEKRYVAALRRCPASQLPRAKAELRQLRWVIRLVQERRLASGDSPAAPVVELMR